MKYTPVPHIQYVLFCLILFCSLLPTSTVQARDVSFTWTANSEPVDGYNLYYKVDTSGGEPYDGTGAVEGSSPVNTGNVTSFTLHGISDTETYYFVLTAFSGTLESDYSTELTLGPISDPPVAVDSAVSTTEDQMISGTVTATNDSGLSISYQVQQDVSNGLLVLETESGNFSYTPEADFAGTDFFTFLAQDANGDSNIATVSVTITAVNDPPTAQNASLTVNEDTAAAGQLQAQDPEGDTLIYSVVSNPGQGSVTVNANGSFTYAPAADATGADAFTFKANDGQADSNTATVSITINPVNDVPVAQNSALEAFFGEASTGTLQATDADNDPLTYSITSDPQQIVTLTDAATGAFSITPVAGMTSPYSFTFTAGDGTANSNTGTVTVTILEPGTITEIFGDTPDSTHPGTLTDTFTNLNEDINAAGEELLTYSWSNPTPHKPANTIIIKADLSSLKKNFQITEARLYLYQTGANGEESYPNSIHMITGKNPVIDQVNGYNAFNGELWTPVAPETTYNDIPLGLADIGPAEDTINLTNQQGYQSWLVTDMVQNWVNNSATNFGLLLTGAPTASETGRTFAATENLNSSIRPKLVIRYIKKPAKPNVISARPVK